MKVFSEKDPQFVRTRVRLWGIAMGLIVVVIEVRVIRVFSSRCSGELMRIGNCYGEESKIQILNTCAIQ